MPLPPFADVADLSVRIPDGISVADEDRAAAVLSDASTLVRTEAGKTWVNADGELENVPDIVFVVTLGLARRAFVNPDGVRQEMIDTYQVQWNSEDGAWRQEIRRAAGTNQLSNIRLVSDVPRASRVIYGPDLDELYEGDES